MKKGSVFCTKKRSLLYMNCCLVPFVVDLQLYKISGDYQ